MWELLDIWNVEDFCFYNFQSRINFYEIVNEVEVCYGREVVWIVFEVVVVFLDYILYWIEDKLIVKLNKIFGIIEMYFICVGINLSGKYGIEKVLIQKLNVLSSILCILLGLLEEKWLVDDLLFCGGLSWGGLVVNVGVFFEDGYGQGFGQRSGYISVGRRVNIVQRERYRF